MNHWQKKKTNMRGMQHVTSKFAASWHVEKPVQFVVASKLKNDWDGGAWNATEGVASTTGREISLHGRGVCQPHAPDSHTAVPHPLCHLPAAMGTHASSRAPASRSGIPPAWEFHKVHGNFLSNRLWSSSLSSPPFFFSPSSYSSLSNLCLQIQVYSGSHFHQKLLLDGSHTQVQY